MALLANSHYRIGDDEILKEDVRDLISINNSESGYSIVSPFAEDALNRNEVRSMPTGETVGNIKIESERHFYLKKEKEEE